MMVLPALVAAIGGASVSAISSGSAWPPPAWDEGEFSELSLVDLALLASGLEPTKQNRLELEAGLAPLGDLESDHIDVTRTALEGLARARWHQLRAIHGLNDQQLAILASANPDQPTPDGWEGILAAVDYDELGEALLALESASARAVEILQRLNDDSHTAVAVSDALDVSLLAPVSILPLAPSADDLAVLATQVAGGHDMIGQANLAGTFADTPPHARAAMYALLEGLAPLSNGSSDDPSGALIGLGAAVDTTRETLLIWSTASMASEVYRVHTDRGIQVPDLNVGVLPLQFGAPSLRSSSSFLPPPPPLADALRGMALTLNDHQTARGAEDAVRSLETTLSSEQQNVIAQVLFQSSRYVTANRVASLVPAPSHLIAHPNLLASWAGMAVGELPDPSSPDAQSLLEARPFLAAQLEAALAREDLMSAVQDAVSAFTLQPQHATVPSLPGLAVPTSSHESVSCNQDRIRVPLNGPAYIHIDPCGDSTTWRDGDLAMLVIDVGGNDTYEGAYGGAPLQLGSIPTRGEVSSPVAIHLDLDGSDTYNATGLDCVLGAACPSTEAALAVLVDWQGDGAETRNEFRSGNQSQGYGRGNGVGVLVERTGTASTLSSFYVAAEWSQAAAEAGGVGALVRMIGQDGRGSAIFHAGNHAQGSVGNRGALDGGSTSLEEGSIFNATGVAGFLNLAGAGAQSPDTYVAGTDSQGSRGLFADVVGSGGRSDDMYTAGNRSRAYGVGGYFLDVLLPETVEQDGIVETSVLPETLAESDVPDPDNLSIEDLPESPLPTVDTSEPFVSVNINSTGPRSSSNDTYRLLGENPLGHGYIPARPSIGSNVIGGEVSDSIQENTTGGEILINITVGLFLDLGGNDSYPSEDIADNQKRWIKPSDNSINPTVGENSTKPTGVDSDEFEDADADFIPRALERLLQGQGASDQDPDDLHPTGRRLLLDYGARQAFLNQTYGLVVTLAGDTVYGPGFSSAILLDLGGNDIHLGRTAVAVGPNATGPYESPQNLLSFVLDLEGSDRYESFVNGSLGFGARGAMGALFDLDGDDWYHGYNYTQGVGVEGGVGILVDLSTGSDINRFRADGRPAQGAGVDNGVGVLVANGDHNTFEDGGSALVSPPDEVRGFLQDVPRVGVDGFHQNGGGVSYNGGDNAPPEALSSGWSGSSDGFAVAGIPYTFTASVRDPDGDRLAVCWTFTGGLADADGVFPKTERCRAVDGEGTVEVEHIWLDVPTDAREDGNDEFRQYGFDLTVTDPGGMKWNLATPTAVYNNPPILAEGGLRFPQAMLFDREYAFQLPFVSVGDDPGPYENAARVDWGDETGGPQLYNATAVDWAKSRWGARIEMPLRYPEPLGPADTDASLELVLDENPATRVTFSHQRQDGDPFNAPATAVIWFEGVRQVRQVGINASWSLDSSSPVTRISLDSVQADGSTLPIDIVTLDRETDCSPCVWNFTGFPDMAGLILRQVVPVGDSAASHVFELGDVFALGPGATHAWGAAGQYKINYTILDKYGGRNGATELIDIISGNSIGLIEGPPMKLLDVGGRGPAHQATLAANNNYKLLLKSEVSALNDQFCIDWGDGSSSCDSEEANIDTPNGKNTELQHAWVSREDPYEVVLTYYPQGKSADGSGEGEQWPIATVHVETALDLRADDSTPILFLTFDDRESWYEGLVDSMGATTPYQAIVDAGGNDRYLGRVASSIPLEVNAGVIAGDILPTPHLLVDAGGDDNYLSTFGRTQAFATHFGVALLADVGGSNVYVSDDEAQAAATRGGISALLSFGGHDTFNPVSASHPDVSLASPRLQEMWLSRPNTLWTNRPVGGGPNLVQGAADDGIAVLITSGDLGVYHAGKRSQGYGMHGVSTVGHYVIPGVDSMCGSPASAPGGAPQANITAAACLLGIGNVRDPGNANDQPYYTNTTPTAPFPQSDSPNHLWCTPGQTNPVNPCVSSRPDSGGLSAFIANGPRYGPGFGAFVRLDGPALLHADSYAQGSADLSGRGLLVGAGGGLALLAHERAQAFSLGGTAGTALGGTSILRLGSLGQVTFQPGEQDIATMTGPEAGLSFASQAAILLTRGERNAACVDPCGPSGTGINEIDLGIDAVSLPTPEVTVDAPAGPITHTGIETVQINLPEEETLHVVLFAIAYPEWGGPSGPCLGEPLAAPALFFDDVKAGAFSAVLDVGALAGGTDPFLPAGCTELHAFARQLSLDVGGEQVFIGEWAHDTDTVLLLPPVRGMRFVGSNGFSTNGAPVSFSVYVPEPLATTISSPPEFGFRIMPGNHRSGFDNEFHADGTVSVEWTPLPGMSEGKYTLEARARWRSDLDWSSWADLGAEVLVDRNPPAVSVDLQSVPLAVRYQQDINLHGVASDPSGVDAIVFRLIDDEGDIVPMQNRCLVGPLHEIFEEEEGDMACAVLGNPDSDGGVGWHATFRSNNTFQAGDIRIQMNSLDGGGAVGTWQDVATVTLDGAAPRVTRVLTPDGHEAAGPSPENGNSSVYLRIHLCDGVTLEDACTAEGVQSEMVAVSAARIVDGIERVPLMRDPDLDQQTESEVVLGYRWDSSAPDLEIPEGAYDIFIMARDQAGNLFDHNPARSFHVDRTPPELDEVQPILPVMIRPNGEAVEQMALKEGDTLGLGVSGSDVTPDRLIARIPGDSGPLAEVEESWPDLGGKPLTLVMPIGADAGSGHVTVEVEATDLAGNTAIRSVSIPFVTPFDFLSEPHVDARSDSVEVTWALSRALNGPGDGMRVVLQDPAGTQLGIEEPFSPTGGADYSVHFSGLEPGQEYQVLLQLWDGASHTIEQTLPFTTFEEPVGTEVVLVTPEAPTYSGIIPVHGLLFAGAADIRGDLSLYAGNMESNPLSVTDTEDLDAVLVRSIEIEASLGELRDFTLYWDSADLVPPGTGAQIVVLFVQFDDGSTSWNDAVSLRIDNTVPVITPDVTGPAPNSGWYNGTVVVRAAAEDDTQLVPAAPTGSRQNLVYWASVRESGLETDAVIIDEDGTYVIDLLVSDGALPPNTAILSTTVHVDRTPPTLTVQSDLEAPWTNQALVPLMVGANDGGSGLDGYRVRVNNASWIPSFGAPVEVSLEEWGDGEHWVDVEVHDVARNVQRKTLNVLLDRMSPSLVDSRWVGWSQDGEPVLHVVAHDRVGGGGRPSGVDALRFSSTGGAPWSPWMDADVSGFFSVPQAVGGGWLQLRDRAGNVGDPVELESPSEPRPETSEELIPPSVTLLTGQGVSPLEGSPQTRFTFSVRVGSLAGAFPDEVVLHVADQLHSMQPEGPVLEGGFRIHTATILLSASLLDAPHAFHVTARYGDQFLEGPTSIGPTVFALGVRGNDPGDVDHDAPGPALALVLALFLSLILYRRRYQS